MENGRECKIMEEKVRIMEEKVRIVEEQVRKNSKWP